MSPSDEHGGRGPLPGPLRVHVSAGEAVGEPELREMWTFRLGIVRLKPHVQPEDDFASFRRFCQHAGSVMRLRDGDGTLRGTLTFGLHEGVLLERPFRLVIPEYFFLDERLRGTPWVPWAVMRTLVSLPPSPKGARVMVGGIGYPTSTLSLDRYFPPVWLYGDAEAPPLAAHLLEWMRTDMAGPRWNAPRRCVEMGSLPPPPSEAWLARVGRRPIYQRYAERCPDWVEGRTVPAVAEFSLPRLLGMLAHVPRRLWRKRQARASRR